MTKLNLPDIGTLANSTSARQAINDNFTAIEAEFDNSLSRDGSTPNQMEADIDLNDHKLLNVADPVDEADGVNLRSVRPLVEDFINDIAETIIEGTARVEVFTATAGQTDFALEESPGTVNNLMLVDSGIVMTPGVDYTLTGSDLKTATFFVGRDVGNEIVARYTQLAPTDSILRGDLNNPVSSYGGDLIAYTPTSTGVLSTVKAFLESLWTAGASTGAALIRFLQSGTGAEARTAQAKMRDIVHADDFACVGDGATDDTTRLQNMFTAGSGKMVILGNNKTYAISTTTGLTIPANTTLIANGSKFKRLTAKVGAVADADYNIIIGDDCVIDTFEVECPGGIADIGGVIVSGSNVHIGTLKIISLAVGGAGNGLAWNAVRIGPNSGSTSNVHIGRLVCSDWDRAIVVQNIEGWSIGYVDVDTYRRGIYLKDCSQGVINGGYLRGLSATSTGAAGDNGILMESSTAHGSLHDIRINNVTIEDSGEHGSRIGGQFIARNIWHTNCHVKNSGAANSGVYPPANNGGCGFKALGPTSVFGSRHQNIHYIDCSVEDVNATSIANLIARGGKSNFAGFQLGKVFGGSIVNPTILKRPADSATYAETGNSCFNGIEIIGCQKISITNPQIQRPSNSGIYIYDFSDGVNDWGQTDEIDIVGGHINTPGVAGVEIDCSVITMRRINIQGHLAVNAGQYTMKVAKSGTGVFVNCWASMRSISPSVESFNGLSTDWTITVQGTEVGASACANGSTWQSATAGTLRVRKAGAWASL